MSREEGVTRKRFISHSFWYVPNNILHLLNEGRFTTIRTCSQKYCDIVYISDIESQITAFVTEG